jgi:hypothetical protein
MSSGRSHHGKKLQVTYSKLLKYTLENKFYEVEESNGNVNIIFSPNFPEAEAHSQGESVRIIMRGKLSGSKLVFEHIFVDDGSGIKEKDMIEAVFTYQAWLQFIEENY